MEENPKNIIPGIEAVKSGVRRHPRFDVELPVDYRRSNSSRHHVGWGSNLSEEGMSLQLPEAMEVGQRLNVKLYYTYGSRLHSIRILSKVVWRQNRTEQNQGSTHCGVQFINVSPRDLKRLKRFLSSLSPQLPYSLKNILSCLEKDATN